MTKLKAPKDCPGISFGVNWFATDSNGNVELPDEYVETAKQNGFTVPAPVSSKRVRSEDSQ